MITEEVYFDVTFPQKGISNTGEHVIEQSRLNSCAVNYNIGETYQVLLESFSRLLEGLTDSIVSR